MVQYHQLKATFFMIIIQNMISIVLVLLKIITVVTFQNTPSLLWANHRSLNIFSTKGKHARHNVLWINNKDENNKEKSQSRLLNDDRKYFIQSFQNSMGYLQQNDANTADVIVPSANRIISNENNIAINMELQRIAHEKHNIDELNKLNNAKNITTKNYKTTRGKTSTFK